MATLIDRLTSATLRREGMELDYSDVRLLAQAIRILQRISVEDLWIMSDGELRNSPSRERLEQVLELLRLITEPQFQETDDLDLPRTGS